MMYQEMQITLFTVFINPLLLIGIIIGIFITKQLNKRNKGEYFAGLLMAFTCLFLIPKAIDNVECLKKATYSRTCEAPSALIWIILFDCFIISGITIVYNIILNIKNKKILNDIKSPIEKKKEEFIKNPNDNLKEDIVITQKKKIKCSKCNTPNAVDAKRCFVCGEEFIELPKRK